MKSAAERCDGVGTFACKAFRDRIFKRHRSLDHVLASEYLRINRKSGYVAANVFLGSVDDELKLGGTGLFADMPDSAFVEYASEKSKMCEIDIMQTGRRLGSAQAIAMAEMICKRAGVQYPAEIKPGDSKEEAIDKHVAAMARLCDAKWWRRKIRAWAARVVESFLRRIGSVNRRRGLYVSDFTLHRRNEQRKRNEKILAGLVAENEEGFSINLQEAAGAGISNPVNRRNELMVRIRGYEELAGALDCVGVFVTLTAPSKYHAINSGGGINAKFAGFDPGEVQQYLCGVWSCVRAQWHKKGIRVFGFRFVEPHHDGTPHWHQLLFIKKENIKEALDIFERWAIAEERDELSSDISPRFLAVQIDPALGSAAGYVAKYVSKNIDGEGVGGDFESQHGMTEAQKTAARVRAWASTWGIRQFQQIGSVSVTVWRELRRGVDRVAEKAAGMGGEGGDVLEALSIACESQNWAAFVELMGGAFAGRDELLARPLYVVADNENKYGELFERVRGVLMRGCFAFVTRWHSWTIRKVSGASSVGLVGWRESPPLGLV